MEIRGRRECAECGTRWSYYDTGEVSCPECGSLRSVGVEEERRLHTDSPVEFDLTPVRGQVDEAPLREVAEEAIDEARSYVRKRGFVDAGQLRTLDDTYLAARELAGVGDVARRAIDLSDDEEWYFLELLRGADLGERPDPEDVPASLRAARGLAYAEAVREYRRAVSRWLDATDDPPGEDYARETLGALDDHARRVRALEGDVPPEQSEALVAAARALGSYLRAEDPDGLARCRETLRELVED